MPPDEPKKGDPIRMALCHLWMPFRKASVARVVVLVAAAAATSRCAGPTRAANAQLDGGTQAMATSRGASAMTRDRLLEQLRTIDQAKIDALASSLTAASRAAPRAAAALSLGADAEVAIRAEQLLLNMEDLAIVPWLDALTASSPEQRVLVLRRTVEAELALRRKVVARLDELLDDRTPVSVPTTGPMEQKPPRRRVCDEAYLLMRRMVHFGESPLDAGVQAKIFLNAPDDFKDAQIKQARASSVWNRAITGKDVEDYAESHPDPGGAARPTPAGSVLKPKR